MEKQNNNLDSSPNAVKKNEAGSVQGLVFRAIQEMIGMKSTVSEGSFLVDPKQVDAIRDLSKFADNIREQALHIRQNNLESYGDIPDEMIEGISKSKIIYQLTRFTQGLRSLREKLVQISRSTFRDIERTIPSFDNDIDKKISRLNERQLMDIVSSKKNLQQFIERAFSCEPGSLHFPYEKLDTLFPDLEQRDRQLFQWMKNAIRDYERIGSIPDKSRILEVFYLYNQDHSQQKKIADFFGVMFSMKDLTNYQIFSAEDIRNFAHKSLGNQVWSMLSDAEKKRVVRDVQMDDILSVTIDQVPQLPDNVEFDEFLEQKLSERISILEDRGDEGNDVIMGDILPDEENKWYDAWLGKVLKIAKEKKISIPGLESMSVGSVVVFPDPRDQKVQHTLRIDAVDVEIDQIDDGVTYTIISGENGTISSGIGVQQTLSYELFGKFLLSLSSARVLSKEEFELAVTNDPKKVPKKGGSLLQADGTPQVLDTAPQDGEMSETSLMDEVDILDPSNKGILIEPGLTFVSHGDESMTKEYPYVITEVTNSHIVVSHDPNDTTGELFSFSEFLTIVRERGIFRIGKVGFRNDRDFLHALEKYKVGNHTHIENNELVSSESSDHHHGEHHGEKKKEATAYRFFESATGGIIRVWYVGKGQVHFGEFSGIVDLEKIKKGEKLSKKEQEEIYDPIHKVSYAGFLKFIKQGGYEATTKNLLKDPDADYSGHGLHMHEDIFKRWLKKPSLADIIHGIGGIKHAMEHYFEKGSKLSASRSSLWMAKKLGLPADIVAQLSSDEINSMKEIIEKLVSKLQGLNGPIARKKALHIVHSKGSRPEEIAAAALYMVKGYGQLYAEDIKYAQGSESFINALIYSCGYTSSSQIEEQKRKARSKFRAEVGTEPGGQIIEEEMIWGFLKTVDGNADTNPLAGALSKAMGNPSGWERAWRTEGHKDAIEKGKRQSNDIPNPQGRRNKYFSALATHEFNTAYGIMVNVAGKDKSPAGQGAPIVWCLTGITQYASTKLSQEGLWQFVASQGHSLHAYSFLRTKTWNDVYRDMFIQAMDGIADPNDIVAVKKAIQEVQYHGHDTSDRESKKQQKNFELINQMWVKYQGKGLHDRLQGRNSWLVEQVHEHHNEKAEEYLSILNNGHIQMSKNQPPSNDNGWNDEFGYNGSPIIHNTSDNLISLEWHVNKIKKDGSTNFALNQDDFKRFWPPVMNMFENLRNDTGLSEHLKKKQYFQFRKDILEHFRLLLNTFGRGEASTEVMRSIRAQPYSRDLLMLGITLEQIFSESYDLYDGVAENDYRSWLHGGRGIISSTENQVIQNKTREFITERLSANENRFQRAA